MSHPSFTTTALNRALSALQESWPYLYGSLARRLSKIHTINSLPSDSFADYEKGD